MTTRPALVRSLFAAAALASCLALSGCSFDPTIPSGAYYCTQEAPCPRGLTCEYLPDHSRGVCCLEPGCAALLLGDAGPHDGPAPQSDVAPLDHFGDGPADGPGDAPADAPLVAAPDGGRDVLDAPEDVPPTIGDGGFDHASTEVAPQSNGAECKDGSACKSGYCVDGYCCDDECRGSCVQCNLPNKRGLCSPVPKGQTAPDRSACVTDKTETCGQTGLCDGTGKCAFFDEGEICAKASCAADQVTPPRTCDGMGICKAAAQARPCAPFRCDPKNAEACATSCSKSEECIDAGCTENRCGRVGKGAACERKEHCQEGLYCSPDGRCCDMACTGACESCNLPDKEGACTNLPAGQASRKPAPNGCADKLVCDGQGACKKGPGDTCSNGTECTTGSCVDGRCCTRSACGACEACTGDGGVCAAIVNGDDPDNCKGDRTCDANHQCKIKQGMACKASVPDECRSGLSCVDGYCCNSPCGESCQACDLLGKEGTCSPLPEGEPHGSRPTCSGEGICAGACSGQEDGKCGYPNHPCKDSRCALDIFVDRSTCSQGRCVTPPAAPCGDGFSCIDSYRCNTECNDGGGCIDSHFCHSGKCVLDAKEIAVSHSHACAILEGGALKCWGIAGYGALGPMLTTGSTHVPVEVFSNGVSAVATGGNFTCAILSGGKVKCWGINLFGQIGIHPITDKTPQPQDVPVDNATMLAAGGSHVCALHGGGAVSCWGNNNLFQLGPNAKGSQSHTPAQVFASGVKSIAAGDTHTCALLLGGAVKCWGDDSVDQLGPKAAGLYQWAEPQEVFASGASAIDAGGEHSCAVVTTATEPWPHPECWGSNSRGQLGPFVSSNRSAIPTVASTRNSFAVSTGFAHSCAMWGPGYVECWGANSRGQAGDQPSTTVSAPFPVFTATPATRLASGGNGNCALMENGAVKCWGENDASQLGVPEETTPYSATPVSVTPW